MSLLKNIRKSPQLSAYVWDPRQLIKVFYSSCKTESGCKKKATEADDPRMVKLPNGMRIPLVGMGTWGSRLREMESGLKLAIDAGYRHIDTAMVYENEKEVGAAIKAKIDDKTVKREDLFIVSKLWNNFHDPAAVCKSCEETLRHLDVSYVDMLVMHWPTGFKEDWAKYYPLDAKGNVLFSNVHYIDTWQAMELLVKNGLCRSLGVSNFNKCQLERILSIAKEPLCVNQIECHPYLTQNRLRAFCKSKNIVVVAYAPLGSPTNPYREKTDPFLLKDERIHKIAEKHKKTPAQIAIRFHVELGNVTIPKSVQLDRIKANLDVFNFKLDKEDMQALLCLNINLRYVPFCQAKDHIFYPFNDDF